MKKTFTLSGRPIPILITLFIVFIYGNVWSQTFPNPATLSTGQGALGSADPIWQVSEFWYASAPPNPIGLNYTPALINSNCAPGAWVDAAALPPPVNNGNWITGPDANCATNTGAGYRYFRLTLNLPPDCNGYSVTVPGNYVLSFDGYVDNQIANIFINGTAQGISGGGFSAGSQLSFTLNGPWVAGTNYVDIMVYNFPNGGGSNPYGLLLVANATSPTDTDNDGVANIDDLCPCTPGNNAVGCLDPSNVHNCDIAQIRQAFTNAGCVEMASCVSDCSIYFLNPQTMTGSQAQAFAQTLGANLVSVGSATENSCILTSLVDMGYGNGDVVWIGFSDEVSEGNFVWYDQAPIVYTNWAPGEPNQSGDEDCVQIYPGGAYPGTWNDLSCTSTGSKSIIEVNLCPVINAGADVAICIGATANLAASNTLFGSSPYTYAWSNGVNVQPNPVAPTDTTEYRVVTTDRYQCTSTDTVVVNVNPLPVVDAGADVSVCPQQSVTLNGSGASTYTWDNGVTDGVAFFPNTASTVYTVTGTDVNGCQDTDQVTVSVELNGCPGFPNEYHCDIDQIRQVFSAAGCTEMVGCVSECSIYFLNPQSMSGSQAQTFAQTMGANLVSVQSAAENQCIISSLNSMGQSGVIWIGFSDEISEGNFVWYDQSPIVYTNWAPGEPNQSGDEDCTQIYPDGQWNDLSCASANAKSIIEVNLCPVINAGPDVTLCAGDTAPLMASNTLFGSAPYTYAWSNGVNVQPNPVAPSDTTEYRVVTIDRYQCGTTDTVLVNVNQLPVVEAGANVTVCPLESVTLNGSGATSYTWDNGGTDGVSFVPAAPWAMFHVTGTDANGCQSIDSVEVAVAPSPVVDAGNDTLVCEGSLVTLTGSGAPFYSWDNGVTDGVAFPVFATTTFTLTGTSAQGCVATDQMTVGMSPAPVVSFVPNQTVGCSPFQVTFTGTSLPGAAYQWTFGNGNTSASGSTVNYTYTQVGCYDVSFQLTTADGCVGQIAYNQLVCVAPDPVASFMANPTVLSQLNSVASFINTSTGASSYIWNFGDGSSPSGAFSPNHAFPISQPGTYPVVLVAISDVGCVDTTYVEMEVQEAVTYYVPNSFTPNSDPTNPVFRPIFSADYQLSDYTFTVYNRWGEVLFSSQQADEGWDGTRGNSDKLVEGGLYVWKLQFSTPQLQEYKTLVGNVYLLR